MPSENNKKLIIIYVLEILKSDSDEKHPLTQAQIIKKIECRYGMECERKAIGRAIDSLEDLGFDIIKNNGGGCFLASRDFEPSEINFLVDAIFSSKSLSGKQAKELTEKITKSCSSYEKKKFKYIHKTSEVLRSDNKQLFYVIDIISAAIEENKKISFIYNKFNFSKSLTPRFNGMRYVVNPYFMVNSRGQYFLVANYDKFNDISNYKIDRITDIQILKDDIKPLNKLQGLEKGIDIAKYVNENIYMFGGKSITAKIKFEDENKVDEIIEWFGKNTHLKKEGENLTAEICADERALVYWALQYGESIEVLYPIEVREKIKDIINKMQKKYE